ncbi:MAG: MerR family transcriptional regulator [Deltaproteobacteria bacterium]|nr:MerR family transcriptional regulator [Deltaproteobacteria bacterium]
MNRLTIGKLAKQVGVGIETVRFYERQGLIDPPPRTESNYRVYPEDEVVRLKFIKRAKALGFTLNEIKELLFIRHDPHATKADIKNRTLAKIKDIEKKINDLARIKTALEHLASSCDGHGPLNECPILEALETGSDKNCKH